MEKNWFVVYTKPAYELKVSSVLTKIKAENYCPLNKSGTATNKERSLTDVDITQELKWPI
jgi:transcription antitermination factor NusG